MTLPISSWKVWRAFCPITLVLPNQRWLGSTRACVPVTKVHHNLKITSWPYQHHIHNYCNDLQKYYDKKNRKRGVSMNVNINNDFQEDWWKNIRFKVWKKHYGRQSLVSMRKALPTLRTKHHFILNRAYPPRSQPLRPPQDTRGWLMLVHWALVITEQSI